MAANVTATFIGSFDNLPVFRCGITKVEEKIYVLNHNTDRIKVYEDTGFRFMTDIALSNSVWSCDMVYSNKSKCVYIYDWNGDCIRVMTTTGEHRLTKLLTFGGRTYTYTLSLSNEGQLLVLRKNRPTFSQDSLDIYSLNATLIRRLLLPQDVKYPQHVVQTLSGNFILLHRMNDESSGPWAISQLTNDGQLINRFISRNQSQILNSSQHMALDSDNNRLFVADFNTHQVILFDSFDLTWSQVLLSREKNGILKPRRLLFDASKKHLFVAEYRGNVTVFEIN